MRGTTHLLLGLVLTAVLLESLRIDRPLLLAALVLLGSLLPDIDTASSRLGRHFPLVGFLFEHRTLFHSIAAMTAGVIVLASVLPIGYALAFAAGFAGHLALDALTPQGVRPFWPSKARLRGPVRVGGLVEAAVSVSLTVLFLSLLIG